MKKHNIKNLRILYGITRIQLITELKKLGITMGESTLYHIEKHKRVLKFKEAKAIQKALANLSGKKVSIFCGGEEI